MSSTETENPILKMERLRDEFLEKHKADIQNDKYHPNDLEKIRKNATWVRAFYRHSLGNNDKAIATIHDTLLWRKNIGLNDLMQQKFPFEEKHFMAAGIYVRHADKKGQPLMFLQVKKHKKDKYPHELVCKFIAYVLEKQYTHSVDNPIVFIFDCYDAGYKNTDLELQRFIFNCCKTYFPGLVDYVIVYNMPFIFTGFWKIFKALLPAAFISYIKFLNKQELKEYIDEANLPVHMGGKDRIVEESAKHGYDFHAVALQAISIVS